MLIILTITALIVPALARDYQSEYEALANTEAIQTFFGEIDQADLVDAVAEICSERDMEYVSSVFREGIGDNMNIHKLWPCSTRIIYHMTYHVYT